MAYNWRFYQETGKVGGTANPSHKTIYLDVYNGLDANVGAYNSPKQSLQGVLDGMASVSMTEADVIVASGVYDEGNFLNRRTNISIIAEGTVVFKPTLSSSFNPATTYTNYNIDFHSVNKVRNYGLIVVSDYSTLVKLGVDWSSLETRIFGAYKTSFVNCTNINDTTDTTLNTFKLCEYCYFLNSNIRFINFQNSAQETFFRNNSLVNSRSSYRWGGGAGLFNIVNDHYDIDSIFATIAGQTSLINNRNFHEGSKTGKFNIDGTLYSNLTAYRVAHSTREANSPLYTITPLFNLVNPKDLTLQAASPLVGAGFLNRNIGAFDVASVQGASDANWIISAEIDNTTITGQATLIGSPTGTLISDDWVDSGSVRVMSRILLPDNVIDASLGEVISTDLASVNSPNRYSVEVDYSLDGISGNPDGWLKVPIGTQPFHDTVNGVGNGDSSFDMSNAIKITYRYWKMRVTLRDNEVTI